MNKIIYLAIFLVATTVFAQRTGTTPRLTMSGGAIDDSTQLNASSGAEVLNLGEFRVGMEECALRRDGSMHFKYGGQTTVRSSLLTEHSFPTDTPIQYFTFKVCFLVDGFVEADMELIPVVVDTANNKTYKGPALVTVAGPNPPFTGIYYSYTGNPKQSPQVTMPSPEGLFRSQGFQNGTLQFGIEVGPVTPLCTSFPCAYSPSAGGAIIVYGLEVTAQVEFDPTPSQSTSVPTLSSQSGSSRINIVQAPQQPSDGTGVSLSVVCPPNATTYQFATVPWGSPISNKTVTLSRLNQLCGAGTYSIGSSVTIESKPYLSTGPGGSPPFGNGVNRTVTIR